jgi:hypothetical protein
MKYILTSFVASALLAMSFTVPETISFSEFFREAFAKSYTGLDKMKDEKTGLWQFERSVGDFDKCNIRYDLEKGVHAIDFLLKVDNEETARQYVSRYAIQVEKAIPNLEYRSKETSSPTNKSIEFNHRSTDASIQAKNPEVVLTTTKRDGGVFMVITLFEPLNKEQ